MSYQKKKTHPKAHQSLSWFPKLNKSLHGFTIEADFVGMKTSIKGAIVKKYNDCWPIYFCEDGGIDSENTHIKEVTDNYCNLGYQCSLQGLAIWGSSELKGSKQVRPGGNQKMAWVAGFK